MGCSTFIVAGTDGCKIRDNCSKGGKPATPHYKSSTGIWAVYRVFIASLDFKYPYLFSNHWIDVWRKSQTSVISPPSKTEVARGCCLKFGSWGLCVSEQISCSHHQVTTQRHTTWSTYHDCITNLPELSGVKQQPCSMLMDPRDQVLERPQWGWFFCALPCLGPHLGRFGLRGAGIAGIGGSISHMGSSLPCLLPELG